MRCVRRYHLLAVLWGVGGVLGIITSVALILMVPGLPISKISGAGKIILSMSAMYFVVSI